VTFLCASVKVKEQMKFISSEGIALQKYRFFHVLLAFPMAVALFIICRINTLFTLDDDSHLPPLKNNPLIIGYHRDLIYFFCSKAIWRDLSLKETAWIGIHHWSSYVGSLEYLLRGIRCFRFDRTQIQKPFDQIVRFLKQYDRPVFLRTDAGGPYDEVRPSAIKLAINSQRDIVCFRQIGPSYLESLAGHRFPLPFSKILTSFSDSISWRELEKLPLDAATKMVQHKMDSIAFEALARN